MGEAIKELLVIAIGSALVSNVVLSQFYGLCPFLGVSKQLKTAGGMGIAVIFVITLASFVTGLIYDGILVRFGLEYLQTIVFILVIAALVQFVEMFLKKFIPALYQSLGIYLPLITTNCAVLGVALTNVTKQYGVLASVVNGFATAVGLSSVDENNLETVRNFVAKLGGEIRGTFDNLWIHGDENRAERIAENSAFEERQQYQQKH